MPVLRQIACPACGASRTTKAGEGTRMRCPSCSATFRAPAPPPELVDQAAPPPADSTPGVQPTSTKRTPGARVERAESVTVRPTRAKPKAKPKKSAPDGASGAPGTPPTATKDQPAPSPPAAPPRRGFGSAMFMERVRGHQG